MILSIENFGSGLGLVIASWVVGMAVNAVFNSINPR